VPQDCFDDRQIDLVVPFHGAPPVMGHALGEARLNAALAVENLGTISQDYASAYTVVARLDDLVRRAMGLVARLCPGREYHPRRLALSAWSAGYAAVGAILARPERGEGRRGHASDGLTARSWIRAGASSPQRARAVRRVARGRFLAPG
jgi:hypothetical protein